MVKTLPDFLTASASRCACPESVTIGFSIRPWQLAWTACTPCSKSMRSSHLRKALSEPDKVEADVVKQQRTGAEPRSYRYDLVPRI